MLRKLSLGILLAAALALSGCSAAGQAPTAEPTPAAEVKPVVSATGVVVPARWSTLSMPTSGVVDEIPLQENETASPGQVLVRLQGKENLQAAVAAARMELASAQHDLDLLYKDLDLQAAGAAQAVVEARLELRDAERRLANLKASSALRDIEQARANVAILKDKVNQARKDYRPYENKPEDNLVRAGLLSRLAQIEKQYESAVRKLNNLQGTVNELDLLEAQADLDMANARLAAALREQDIRKGGPDPKEVSLAEARLENARAQLAAAEAALKDLELLAPFQGVISELSVKPSQYIAPGQPVLQLADLEHLRVETTDLNEIDVARLKIGDAATVTFDALPDVSVKGQVTQIAPKAASGAGVNYAVTLELAEIPASLRWGMTAFVDIEVE